MKYLPSIVPALVAVAGMFAPQLQAIVSAHPSIALVLAALIAIFNHALPSSTAAPKL